jgi:hypothetical protein
MVTMRGVHPLFLLLAAALCACGARPGLDPEPDGHSAWDADVDAAPQRDGGVADAYQPPTCTLATSNSDVQGTTPLGPIDLPYAFAGMTGGECAEGLLLYLFEVDTVIWEHPEPSLELRAVPGPALGVHVIDVWIAKDGAWESTTGELDITYFDDWWQDPTGRVRARVSIVGDGWNVTGEVDAPYCDALMMWCI